MKETGSCVGAHFRHGFKTNTDYSDKPHEKSASPPLLLTPNPDPDPGPDPLAGPLKLLPVVSLSFCSIRLLQNDLLCLVCVIGSRKESFF